MKIPKFPNVLIALVQKCRRATECSRKPEAWTFLLAPYVRIGIVECHVHKHKYRARIPQCPFPLGFHSESPCATPALPPAVAPRRLTEKTAGSPDDAPRTQAANVWAVGVGVGNKIGGEATSEEKKCYRGCEAQPCTSKRSFFSFLQFPQYSGEFTKKEGKCWQLQYQLLFTFIAASLLCALFSRDASLFVAPRLFFVGVGFSSVDCSCRKYERTK